MWNKGPGLYPTVISPSLPLCYLVDSVTISIRRDSLYPVPDNYIIGTSASQSTKAQSYFGNQL